MKRICFLFFLLLGLAAHCCFAEKVVVYIPPEQLEEAVTAAPSPAPATQAPAASTPSPVPATQTPTASPVPVTQAPATASPSPVPVTQTPAATSRAAVLSVSMPAPAASQPTAASSGASAWYDPTWYDESTGSLDLSGLEVRSAAQLEMLLRAVPGLKYADLSFCSLSNEELAQVRDDMAPLGVKVVWTLTLKYGYTLRTDDWVFSTRHSSKDPRLEDEDVACLRYATELRALDLGHNWIFDASFLAPMNELRVLILSDNKMDDLSCLAGKPLEYLEIFNTHVNDISFLYGCDTLLDINLCHTWVRDLSPLYHLKSLKRIWMGDAPMLTLAERKRFLAYQEKNLEAYDFWTDIPTLYGWRGDEDGPGHPRYEIIKAMFKENVYYDFNTVLRPDQYVYLYKK